MTAGLLALSACATAPAQVASAPPPPPKQYQWLLGSGEAAVLSRQAYDGMVDHVAAALDARKAGRAVDSAIFAPGATPTAPSWASCGAKPPAVVLDMDETAILNTGANYDTALRGDPPFDPARWERWEQDGATLVEPAPGAVDALAKLRAAGVAVVFNSNRENRFARQATEALRAAGLGDAKPGETLFLRGDVAPGSGKDPRRTAIAERYCVLAMAGDQLGDFSDAFNDKALGVQQRRALAVTPGIAGKWGKGWFLLPNPMYGPGVAGGYDDLFPADKRWTPKGAN
ncbi:5'-nucleotidase, lipoprotein e(P4) family [Sphingomonas qomolangmaensis]|uniref:Acid phosphatase n=1 Tax=Sphingomonas qomolangmaensis TaxID=2918765 RepID=A0ABY5L4Y8_9SPHN|nr:HAD family acid phosphatase [Sphingomonas qomolangmaensis]UUL81231.1 acid phosphatase [Sphingomonas qomolangmaensis]